MTGDEADLARVRFIQYRESSPTPFRHKSDA